ncbi:MAG TPA: haloacid dehalogenase type II [Steroidobacteraceae bacterium]|nr:haloacid dehalogenase type II [Steroidobacteraceae bacterium]
MAAIPLLVFDVNETLLDLDALQPHFERMFGDRAALREWFAQLILYSEALTLSDNYVPFGELGARVLEMLAVIRGVPLGEDDRLALGEAIAAMPPHAEVPAALLELRGAGFRLFTLTNNPAAVCARQLERAGISRHFDRQFSVDDGTRRYKPAREVYRAVEHALGVAPSELCLIACHTWDILGAAAAGWKTAFIARPGNAVLAVGGQPQVVATDLGGVAKELIRRFAT